MSQVRLQLHPLFPTPVASYSGFDQQEVLFETVSSLLKDVPPRLNSQDSRIRHWYDTNSTGFLQINDRVIYALKDWILNCALHFVNEIQGCHCDGLQVISSWCNSAGLGASQAPHSHENSWISGTYYVCFENGHAPISFYRPGFLSQPNKPYFSMYANSHKTSFNAEEVKIAPESGTLLLWPSQLVHGYTIMLGMIGFQSR